MSKVSIETMSKAAKDEEVREFWILQLNGMQLDPKIKDAMLKVLRNPESITDETKNILKQNEKALKTVVTNLQELTKSKFDRNGNIGMGVSGYAPQGTGSRPSMGRRG